MVDGWGYKLGIVGGRWMHIRVVDGWGLGLGAVVVDGVRKWCGTEIWCKENTSSK